MLEKENISVTRVTDTNAHHFFGYYDKTPWDMTGNYMLALESNFADRNPELKDSLSIGLIDLKTKEFYKLAKTSAWNWQQGCMLKWMPNKESEMIGYNDLCEDQYVHVAMNIHNGKKEILPWAIYDLSSDCKFGGTLNFERITHTRPGYGYFGLPDPYENDLAPEDDGIYIVDIENKKRSLIFNLSQANDFGEIKPAIDNKTWFNHIKFNPSGNRLLFLQRWAPKAISGHHGFQTRLFTIGVDGSKPSLLIEGVGISHFDWFDDEHILIWLWSEDDNPELNHYFMVRDFDGQSDAVAKGQFECDGHCSLSPDRKWMLTDTYPKGPKNEQTLIIYNFETEERVDVGKFTAMTVEDDSLRCDLHPRWNRKGTKICFDSTHEGSRQMYIADVSNLTETKQKAFI